MLSRGIDMRRARLTTYAPLGASLRHEAVGGWLALASALVALVWINTRWGQSYERLRELPIGAWGVDWTLRHWASEGLLAVFFLVVALELRREIAVGALRARRAVAVPVVAALGGVLVPAGLYLLVTTGSGAPAMRGWAVPTATDIAFALAILAVIGRRLPAAARAFLLTLAVVDDLIAIGLIAIVYTDGLRLAPLLLVIAPLTAFHLVLARRPGRWWLVAPLAISVWALVHQSGIHATLAGVILAFAVPSCGGRPASPARADLVAHLEHRLRPLSAMIAVPLFAFVSAGVRIDGPTGLLRALSEPAAAGVAVGLVVGKPLGIIAGAYLAARLFRVRLDTLRAPEILVVGLLGGVGFTVSLLLAELSFGVGTDRQDDATVAVLTASVLAALSATAVARSRAPDRVSAAPAGRAVTAGVGATLSTAAQDRFPRQSCQEVSRACTGGRGAVAWSTLNRRSWWASG